MPAIPAGAAQGSMDNGNGNGGIIGRLSAASPSFVPSVALDLTTEEREKLLAVIGSQFDLEILLKYREVKALENELERVQELKGLVQKLILNEHIYGESGVGGGRVSAPPGKHISSSSAAAYLQALEMDEDDEVFYHRRSASTIAGLSAGDEMIGYGSSRRRTASMAAVSLSGSKLGGISSAPQVLYDVRPDGTVVRMRCPVCGQERFRNMLGFVNHCRLNCKLVFITQEERLLKGGLPVPAADVPEEYKHLLSAEVTQDLEVVQICADVQPVQVLEHLQPEIEVEDEEALDPAAFGLNALNLTSQLQDCSMEQAASDLSSSAIRQASRSVSRYYLRGLLVVGNQARCILGSGEEVWLGGRAATHFFKLYIDDVPNGIGNHEALGRSALRHVKFVRFFLHPAYRPDDVVDIYERPFVLERPAYGEVPIRIQLHFYDEKNKPVDILHSVSIFSVTGAAYKHASERRVDIDIDKRTDFSLSDTNFAPELNRPIPDLNSPLSKMEQVASLSTGDLVSHQEANLPPGTEVDPTTLKYCRYCGVPHMPQWSFEIIQKNCAWKPRKMKVNTRSSAIGLFSGTQISEAEIKFVPKLKESAAENAAADADADANIPLQPEADDEQKMVMATALQLSLPLLRPSDATASVLTAATRSFLRSLLHGAVKQMPAPEKRAQLDQGLPTVLTPWHVFCAITRSPENPETANSFDFLSNAFLSASSASQQPLQPPQD